MPEEAIIVPGKQPNIKLAFMGGNGLNEGYKLLAKITKKTCSKRPYFGVFFCAQKTNPLFTRGGLGRLHLKGTTSSIE
jgi:hypothetical protein